VIGLALLSLAALLKIVTSITILELGDTAGNLWLSAIIVFGGPLVLAFLWWRHIRSVIGPTEAHYVPPGRYRYQITFDRREIHLGRGELWGDWDWQD
jgi:hypothetical protein